MSTFFDFIFYGFADSDFALVGVGIAMLVLCLYSIILHELGHGFFAKINGDLTAQVNGRLTLNPIKHFDPIGFLSMALVGFGWAKPVPVNPNNFHVYRKGMFQVAIGGVLVNFILAMILCPLYVLFTKLGYIYIAYIIGSTFFLNIALIVFNLIPIAPLDGYRVVQALGKGRGARKYMDFMDNYGFVCLIVFLAFMFFFDFFSYDMFGFQFSPFSWLVQNVSKPLVLLWQWIFGVI